MKKKRIIFIICCFILIFLLVFIFKNDILKLKGTIFGFNGKISINKKDYLYGEPILIETSGSSKDWVGLYKNNEHGGKEKMVYWYYLNDNNISNKNTNLLDAENLRLKNPTLRDIPKGNYSLYLFYNDSWEIIDSVDFTVDDSKDLIVEKERYLVGEKINIKTKGSGNDWVGIYKKGEDPNEVSSIYWYYLKDVIHKYDNSFDYVNKSNIHINREDEKDLKEGTYTINLYKDDSHIPSDSKDIYIQKSLDLKVNKYEYLEGEPIYVNSVGKGKDWVGIYKKGDDPKKEYSICWYYVSDSNSNTELLKANNLKVNKEEYKNLPKGEYTIYLYKDDGYEIVSKQDIKISDAIINKTTFLEGEKIKITSKKDGEYDWIAIYKKGESKDTYVRWYYVSQNGNEYLEPKDIKFGSTVFSNEFKDLPVGEYYAQYFNNPDLDEKNDRDNPGSKISFKVIDGKKYLDSISKVIYDMKPTFNGSAEGKLTIIPSKNTISYNYMVYWGNENGILNNYTGFMIDGNGPNNSVYYFPRGTIIPEGASRLYVYPCIKKEEPIIGRYYQYVDFSSSKNKQNFGKPNFEMQVISDTHIGRKDADKHLEDVLSQIKNDVPNTSGIFINGDVIDSGVFYEGDNVTIANQQYEDLSRILNESGIPRDKFYAAIGNHEFLYEMNISYKEMVDKFQKYMKNPANKTDKVYYDTWINNVHFVFLGSETEGEMYANLSNEQLNWLEKVLADNKDKNKPIFMFLHQGIIDTVTGTLKEQDWHGIKQVERLKEIISKYPEIILFSGHSHWKMDAYNNMKLKDQYLPTVLNTAATGYLWLNENYEVPGYEGYYASVYDDKVIFRGKEFGEKKDVGIAQYLIPYGNFEEVNKKPKYNSSKYNLYNDYIYVGSNDLNLNYINCFNCKTNYINDTLYIKYYDKVLTKKDIVKIRSNKYNISNNTITIKENDSFDINSVFVFNAKKEYYNGKLYITRNDELIDVYNIKNEKSSIIKGDVDNNGKVTSKDVTLVLRHVVGYDKLTGNYLKAADVDNNGKINSKDVTLILRYIVGYIDKL